MKRLMILGAFGALLMLGASGCSLCGEFFGCGRAPRGCRQQACGVSEPCCVTESPCCDPCGGGVPVVAAPCSSCGR
jgi:hypothetical protein